MVPGCIAAKPRVCAWAPLATANAVAPAHAPIRCRIVSMVVPSPSRRLRPSVRGRRRLVDRLRRDIVLFEVPHSARVVRDLVLLVGERRRELAQYRLYGDKLVLVVEERVEDLEDEFIARLDICEEQIVEAVDLHRLLDA